MITVVCVLRSGGVYTAEWVQNLRHGVAGNMGPHRFVCLTDTPMTVEQHGVEVIALANGWPGWWSKIEMFRPGLFDGPVLYIDLDTVITGPLDDLVRRAHGVTMLADLYQPKNKGSGVMAWWGDFSCVYHLFAHDPAAYMASYDRRCDGRIGDQAFIEDVLGANGYEIDTFPMGRIVSFKKDARNGPPDGASMVAFHGMPKMPDAGGWVRW